MEVAGYDYQVYCDNDDCPRGDPESKHWKGAWTPGCFMSETLARARRMARRAGWLIGRTRQLCPLCNPNRRDD